RRGLAGDCQHKTQHVLGAMIHLTHKKVNLLLVSLPLGHILGDANKQASSIRLGSQRRGNKVPKPFAAVLGADYPFMRVRASPCRHELADVLTHFARAFAVSASVQSSMQRNSSLE